MANGKAVVVAGGRPAGVRLCLLRPARAMLSLSPLGQMEGTMRSKLIGFLIGCGLAVMVAPAVACDYGTSAQNSQATSQQTAQSQPASDSGSN